MKNQYFGDENDYKKYGILRMFRSALPDGIAICWMLTPNDGKGTGEFRTYLANPKKWRHYDPELFDALSECPRGVDERSISFARELPGLTSAVFYESELSRDEARRKAYFAHLADLTVGCGSCLL